MTAPAQPGYALTLFVSGASGHSSRALDNARQLCESHLKGRYELSVVDVNEDPAAGLSSRVVVVPTLVKNRPPPVRRLVGELADEAKVLLMLDLPATGDLGTVS